MSDPFDYSNPHPTTRHEALLELAYGDGAKLMAQIERLMEQFPALATEFQNSALATMQHLLGRIDESGQNLDLRAQNLSDQAKLISATLEQRKRVLELDLNQSMRNGIEGAKVAIDNLVPLTAASILREQLPKAVTPVLESVTRETKLLLKEASGAAQNLQNVTKAAHEKIQAIQTHRVWLAPLLSLASGVLVLLLGLTFTQRWPWTLSGVESRLIKHGQFLETLWPTLSGETKVAYENRVKELLAPVDDGE